MLRGRVLKTNGATPGDSLEVSVPQSAPLSAGAMTGKRTKFRTQSGQVQIVSSNLKTLSRKTTE